MAAVTVIVFFLAKESLSSETVARYISGKVHSKICLQCVLFLYIFFVYSFHLNFLVYITSRLTSGTEVESLGVVPAVVSSLFHYSCPMVLLVNTYTQIPPSFFKVRRNLTVVPQWHSPLTMPEISWFTPNLSLPTDLHEVHCSFVYFCIVTKQLSGHKEN